MPFAECREPTLCAQTTTVVCADVTTAGCKSDGEGGFADACAGLTSQAECTAVNSDSNDVTADCSFGSISRSTGADKFGVLTCTRNDFNQADSELTACPAGEFWDTRGTCARQDATGGCTDATTAGCQSDGCGGFEDACKNLVVGVRTTKGACEAVDSDSNEVVSVSVFFGRP